MNQDLRSNNYTIFLHPEQKNFIQSALPLGYSLQTQKTTNDQNAKKKIKKKKPSSIISSTKKPKNQNLEVKKTQILKQKNNLNQHQKQNLAQPHKKIQQSHQNLQQSQYSLNKQKIKSQHQQQYIYQQQQQLQQLTNSRKIEPVSSNQDDMQKCFKILQSLKKHNKSSPFLYPVDPVELNIPDYLNIITHPMDLSTIEQNLSHNIYSSATEFCIDVNQIWENSLLYNQKGSEIYFMTLEMQQYFKKLITENNLVLPNNNIFSSGGGEQGASSFNEISQLEKKVMKLTKEIQQLNDGMAKNSKNKNSSQKKKNTKNGNANTSEITQSDKRKLGQQIRQLDPSQLRRVWEIVSNADRDAINNQEELEFDIDQLKPQVIRQLQQYVNKSLAQNKKKNKKGENKNAKNQQKNNNKNNNNNDDFDNNVSSSNQNGFVISNFLDQSSQQNYNIQSQMSTDFEKINNNNNQNYKPIKQHSINNKPNNQQDDSISSDSSFITDSEESVKN